jgi:hypothetical protein
MRLLILAACAAALLSGCASDTSYAVGADVVYDSSPYYSDVYYVRGYPGVYYHHNAYWRHHGGYWHRSHHHHRGWSRHHAPDRVISVHAGYRR